MDPFHKNLNKQKIVDHRELIDSLNKCLHNDGIHTYIARIYKIFFKINIIKCICNYSAYFLLFIEMLRLKLEWTKKKKKNNNTTCAVILLFRSSASEKK